jgi:hypothetical protein
VLAVFLSKIDLLVVDFGVNMLHPGPEIPRFLKHFPFAESVVKTWDMILAFRVQKIHVVTCNHPISYMGYLHLCNPIINEL